MINFNHTRLHTINSTARREYGIIITIERLNSNSVYLRGALKGKGQRHLFFGLFDWYDSVIENFHFHVFNLNLCMFQFLIKLNLCWVGPKKSVLEILRA